MKLSELNFGKVEKDGEFNWLGLTAEGYEGKKVLTFLNDEKYYKEIENNESITCIITTDEVAKKIEKNKYGIIISKNPRKDFFELHNKLVKENFYFTKRENKISEKAYISEKANIGEYNIIIEDDVIIEAGVTIYENVTIKKGAIIRSGSRIGGNGFEFSRFGDEVLSVSFAGDILIEENVEIQNNTCVDRGVFDRTYLGKNVKVDNLVHIAHDVKIGDNSLIVACTLIGGRTRIGKNSYLGPNCTVKNGLVLGENSKVSMGAVVTKNVKDNEVVTGNFAIPHEQFIKNLKKI
ncbi:UDP-3-O-(3-hydroxymyristoyl)glucosamine N-acyltransferase [Fusobacterium animalis]|uniref:UDP-3-O-[3-hydroxymyristoyl] glucosamine N-acyltransferase n=2 Tax=Fusobacterium animalis TaxID=76859 RepID=R9R9I6_9FUSO|nr:MULTISPECIES: DapH/DapD/GlmU-related protein [Fusobacterium]AGM22709.1 UDP-3-O-[3-hydroxymyristoyl] glucosamine N-acyltransferase [Fusobacterium animalis 4_8]ALF22507.1 UDP-3-O-(3-hydroxymyristoyl) glucosamine N-acyltransferase [Fusobacterium animalis]ASG30554.1 UDP-3-O-(3-hydroxymyristoyl)glucosamine N-acyltransferase [Fusobacterium animalis]EEO43315.1 UDP-3-O-[3-hydroxymyristoyl] glucosamine N-acyltransferase [Fusobacterium animalis 7_1]EEW95016.1 UDP-3-O-[3-hydroxymyristoyl] glucosamine 